MGIEMPQPHTATYVGGHGNILPTNTGGSSPFPCHPESTGIR